MFHETVLKGDIVNLANSSGRALNFTPALSLARDFSRPNTWRTDLGSIECTTASNLHWDDKILEAFA